MSTRPLAQPSRRLALRNRLAVELLERRYQLAFHSTRGLAAPGQPARRRLRLLWDLWRQQGRLRDRLWLCPDAPTYLTVLKDEKRSTVLLDREDSLLWKVIGFSGSSELEAFRVQDAYQRERAALATMNSIEAPPGPLLLESGSLDGQAGFFLGTTPLPGQPACGRTPLAWRQLLPQIAETLLRWYPLAGLSWPTAEQTLETYRERLAQAPIPEDVVNACHRLLSRLPDGDDLPYIPVPTGRVHGDLRPPNVLVHDGTPRLIDWGASRLAPIYSDLLSMEMSLARRPSLGDHGPGFLDPEGEMAVHLPALGAGAGAVFETIHGGGECPLDTARSNLIFGAVDRLIIRGQWDPDVLSGIKTRHLLSRTP